MLGVCELPILIGGATDGASVNIGQHNGLRAKLIAALPGFSGHGVILIDLSWLAKTLLLVHCMKVFQICY